MTIHITPFLGNANLSSKWEASWNHPSPLSIFHSSSNIFLDHEKLELLCDSCKHSSCFRFRNSPFCILGLCISVFLILLGTFSFHLLALLLTRLFSCLRHLNKWRSTFIVLIDVLDDDILLCFFFLDGICCIGYCVWLEESLGLFFIRGVFSWCTCRKFLELIPIVHYFIATCPTFLEVVEDGLSRMEIAGSFSVLLLIVVFETSMTNTSTIPFGLHFNFI